MESDSRNEQELTKDQNDGEPESGKMGNTISYFRDIFQPIWIRRNSIDINQIDRFLIWSQFGFVFPCGIMFWVIFLIIRQ